jgi:2-polyprenyl-3-methyl-5-hydroxy-6-metoxy-1,4-benzoquinol methylase
MEIYLNTNVICNPIFFHEGVRDDPNINVFKCTSTEALVLDKIKKQNYEETGVSYWNTKSIDDAREKTYDDDFRRYNSLKNIEFNSLLDFGCGNGGLLKLLKSQKKNKNVVGIELNNQMIEYLNKEEIETYNSIDKIPQETFDCIMLNHVLEHLYEPIEILHKIKRKMNEKTLLIIEVPHANDILIKHYNCNEFKKFTFWSEHLILHTEKSLFNLLSQIGFTNINIKYEQRYNIFNHLYWLSNGKPGGHKKIDLYNEELVISYNNFLKESKMTDTLIAYCYI